MKSWKKIAIRTALAATVMFLIFINFACDVFELRTLLEGEDGAAWAGPVAIVPGTIDLTTGSTLTFSAKGGSGIYTFSMVTTLGGTVDSSTGYYTAAGIAGPEVIRVADSLSNSADATITVTVGAASTPDYRVAVPPVVAIPPTFPAGGTGGGALSGDFVIENIGGDGGDNIGWRVYISSDNLLGLGDTLVDSGGQGALLAGAVSGLINFSGTWPTSGNTYFLIIELTANDDIAAANNTYASGGIIVSGTPAPDYIINTVASPPSILAGAAINETLTIENQGAGNGSVAVSWEAYISAGDTTIDTGDMLVTSGSVGALASLATTSPAITGNWPAAAGTYYLVCRVSASDDDDNLNNTAAGAAVTVNVPDVDYTITSVTPAAPTAETGGAVLNESFNIDNTGMDDGTTAIDWWAYVSLDALIDAGDTLVGSGSTAAMTAVEAPKNIPVATGNWPAAGGPYYLLAKITADDDTDPSIASNTNSSSAMTINPPDVDYTVPAVTWSTGATAGQTVTGNFDIQNVGTDAGSSTISWIVYASLDNLWDAGDEVTATGTHIAIAGSTTQNQAFTGFWPATPGDYYLVARASASDDPTVAEGATVGTQTITAPAPADVDYNITGVFWSSGTTAGGVVDGSFDIDNVGTDNGTELVYWSTYASLNNIWDAGDALVASGSTTAMTSIEAAKTVNFSGNWPGDPDDYFLVARASASDDATTAENATAASQTVTGPDVDYTITSVTPAAPTTETAGTVLNESFNIDNTGTDDGTQLILWNAYISDNTTIDINDTLVGTGSTAAMTAAEAPRNIPVATGNWPVAGGPYYLLVEIAADDDTDPSIASNTDFSSAVTIDPLDIDYIVQSVTNTNNPAIGGSSINETFTVRNQGAGNGSAAVYWTAYMSTDGTLDAGDTLVDSGTTLALASVTTSAAISIDNGAWPAVSGSTTYFLFVDVSAADEYPTKTGNNNNNASFTINIPDIDYVVTSVSNANTPANINTAISETFTYKNQGADNGSSDVLWIAYSSTDQTFDAGDQIVDFGTETALANGVTSGAIPITGTWSASSGVYYLIVKLSAGDETYSLNNYDASASFTINAPADIDYIVTSITTNYLMVTTNSPISETFDMTNAGGLPGAQTVSWTAYASTDTVLDGGDTTVGSSPTGFLAAGASATAIPITGTWPGAPGSYYLFVEVSAIDETITGNNNTYSGSFTVDNPPDYAISSVTMPAAGEVSTVFNGDFTIQEMLGFPGKKTIQWAVYLSTDQGLGGDVLVQSGTHAALQGDDAAVGGPDETTINFTGNWPADTGEYYLLINIDADDDSNAGNDLDVSTKYEIFIVEIESNDDSGPTNSSLSPVHDVGVLDLGETIIIEGTMDASVGYDTFKFQIGAGVITVSTYATWSTGGDDIDLFIWDENNFSGSSLQIGPDAEPLSGTYGVTGWTAGEFGYVGVQFIDGGVGQPYYVRIMGE